MRGAKKGLKLVGVRLTPEEIAVLRREARRRADERDSMKPDVSEVVREAVELWIASRKK